MHTEQLATADALAVAEEAIRSFPTRREVHHCEAPFSVSPFAIYGACPICGTRIKLRSFSAGTETEDLFDAFFEWMNRPGAGAIAGHRMAEIAADAD